MNYLSLDTETTGLDPNTCQILQIAGYIEDPIKLLPRERCPQFNIFLDHKILRGEPYAMNMNSWIINKLAKNDYTGLEKLMDPKEVGAFLFNFCKANGLYDNEKEKLVIAGKNISFDKRMIKRLIRGYDFTETWYHNVLDPTTSFTSIIEDKFPVSLNKIMERADLDGEQSHNASEDAWDVIRVLRTKY